jgi:leucyl aminopeptidase (aminopeptidase T)
MVPSKRLRELASKGAERVLRMCLPLKHGETVAMFFDEETAGCAKALGKAARELELKFIERRVGAAEQKKRSELATLDPSDESAIEESRAVLISLSSRKQGMPYRRRLVHRAVDDYRYVGLMPGASLKLLAYAVDIDYEEVERKCDDLAVAMLAGRSAVLTTYTAERNGSSGRSYELRMDLGNFRRSPITSTGIIPLGTWGNLPGGETFIAPIETTADGNYVLNGAYTGCVMRPGKPLLLKFVDGNLVEVEGEREGQSRFKAMLKEAGEGDWRNRLGLAELGIGVNEGLYELTGDAIFDEKKAGTAHIAVGDNSIYGGTMQSPLHEDFITEAPSLAIDGKQILDRGRYVLNALEWRENRQTALELGRELPEEFEIQKTALHGNADRSGAMRVTRWVGAQRKCEYTVGGAEISADLARLYELFPPAPESIRYSLLSERWHKIRGQEGDEYIRGLLATLCKHGLSEVSGARVSERGARA